METPAPGQNMDSAAVPIEDGSKNCQPQQQQQQHGHHHLEQLVGVESLEREGFHSQPPPIHFGGGIPPINNDRIPVVGQKRDANGFAAASNGVPISNPTVSQDGKSFIKLFVGFVPRTITEDEIRPIFAEHGNVLEVVLVKDKITGQQRGCCFIRYATIEEADRAIKALDNNYTLPGGAAPITVKYADGELERLGAVEYKLFVSNVNTQATEKEIEEIFARYGRVEYVYILRDELKQSKGSAFVKYGTREMATGAIEALNGTFVMEGCQRPLFVRYSESKKRRIGSDAPYPAFGRQASGYVPMRARNIAGSGRGRRGQCPPTNAHPFGGQIRWNPSEGIPPMVGAMTGSRGHVHGSAWRTVQVAPQRTGPGLSTSPSPGQVFNSAPMQQQTQPYGQQLPQIQQQLQGQVQQQKQHQIQPLPYSELHHNSYQSIQHGQPAQSNEQLPFFQPQLSVPPLPHTVNGSQQLHVSATHLMQLQPQALAEHSVNQPIQPPAIQTHFQSQQFCPPLQQQQQQHLFLKQQQCSMPLQYPLMQQHPTHTMTHPQQIQIVPTPCHDKQPQAHVDQPKPVCMAPAIPPTNATQPVLAATSVVVGGGSGPTLSCNWTQHTSPEGMTYYYNTVSADSKWEKPAELTAFEQQQKQPPLQVMRPQVQIQQTYAHPQFQFQFQPQQLQQSQILQPPIATLWQNPAEVTNFEQQQKQPPQFLQPQSQIQQTHSHPQFQPQQQQQLQIVQPSMPKLNTIPAIAPAKVAEPMTVTVTTVADSRALSHPPLTCDWKDHTSPEGLKYYHNEVTGISQWDKPAELRAFENQQAVQPQP